MVLVVDNFDSFTYNLVQYIGRLGEEVEVRRNNQVDLDEIARMDPSGVLLSPGPCRPEQSGVCLDIVRAATTSGSVMFQRPLFGVCLGHQAIGSVQGGRVERASRIRHGKVSPIVHDGLGVFKGVPSPFNAVRYHSLSVLRQETPPNFIISATSGDDGEIMGIRHESLPIEGVQFHPESVLTDHGLQIVANFVAMCEGSRLRV
ncbi:MAG: aminodeoxychorismate/anthranilate synthase component II [Fimbriimonadaceae bacterium]|nr:aminodeoxychorismate/anthranilate synthase component II [Fimbriimonadaceae bacterium]QYK57299.1 MAG: aminodeoxychorismate/anthranilate synthase component II [Fimbriimonadaceae bacterium]